MKTPSHPETTPRTQRLLSRRSTGIVLAAITGLACIVGTVNAELVLRYDFDEVSGDALDSGMAPPANGTFVGQAGRTNNTPSGTGSALDLVGANNANQNYVVAGSPAKLDNLTTITLTWWMNLKSIPLANDRVIEKLTATAGFGVRFSTPSAATTTMALGVNTTGGPSTSPTISNLNTWTFCAVSYDGSKTNENVQWFIGGQSNPALASGLAGYARGVITNNTSNLRVGSTQASTSDRTPAAWLDDVRIYNTVLSPIEVESIRLESAGGVPSGPNILSFQSGGQTGFVPGGTNITFTAVVSGQKPLSVFLQRNGVNIPGAMATADTNAFVMTYVLTNVVPEHAGTYTIQVTNTLGSATSAPIAIDVTTLFNTEVLTNIWSMDAGSVAFLGTANSERGLAYNPASAVFPNGSLIVPHYVSLANRSIIVIDVATGAYGPSMILTDLATFDMTNGARGLNMVGAAADGAIYVGNLTTSATNIPYYLYRYGSDDFNAALPAIAYSGDPGGTAFGGLRWGETMAVRGSGTGTEILIAPSGGMNLTNFYNWDTNIVALLRTTDGTNFTPTVIHVTNAPSAFATVGLAFGPGNNTFFAKQNNTPLRLVEFDVNTGLGWVKQSYDINAVPGCVSGIGVNAAATKLGAVSVETPDNFRYYDITDLTRDPGLLDQEPFPTNLPNVTAGGLGAVAFGTNGNVYALDSANGIKAFAPNAYSQPASFSLSGVRADPQGAAISFPSQAGRLYQVQSRDSLPEGGWGRVGLPTLGTGSTSTVTNLFLGSHVTNRFYRAVAQ